MDEAASFAHLLKQVRTAKCLTQEELAERAGLSTRTISDLERGIKQHPYSHTIRHLAKALDLDEVQAASFRRAARGAGKTAPGHGDPATAIRGSVSLPLQPTSFIGRQQEVEEIKTLLDRDEVRLLTLTGPGGVGKTRLAVRIAKEVAPRFSDGVIFVSLASLADPGLVPATIAGALDVREEGGQPILETLLEHLRPRQLLLVLDNFEHLLPAGEVISRLLASCPQLTLMVTSRAVLHLSAEHEYPVPPLAVPLSEHLPELGALFRYDAVRLFVQRAQAIKPGFDLTTQNAAAIAEICSRLDGLPLAVELAAARTRLFLPQALLGRLENRLEVLTGRARDVPARQQTLRATLDWSYELLSDGEQMLFCCLAVFVGDCTAEAAEAVCGEAGDWQCEVLPGLESLVDQSLLAVIDQPDGEPRFHMLETVREYALEQLAARRGTEEVRRRHAEVFLQLAEHAEREGAAGDHAVWLARLEQENDNLRAALAWSLRQEGAGEIALRLAAALVWFWSERRSVSEGRRWLEQVLALAVSSHLAESCPRAWAQAASGIGQLARWHGDFATARTFGEQAVAIWRTLDDPRRLVSALRLLHWLMLRQGDHLQARSLLDELVDLSRDASDAETTIHTLRALARTEGQRGNLTVARSRLEEALALSRQNGQTFGEVWTLCSLAEVAWAQGDTAGQRRFHDTALARARALTDPADRADVLGTLAWISMRLGEYEQAADLNMERLTLVRNQGRGAEDWYSSAWALNHLGDVARCQGDEERAVSLYEQSLTEFRQHGQRQGVAAVLHNLGHMALLQGDIGRARSLFLESLSLFRELDFAWSIADCVMGLAAVVGQEGHTRQAALLYGAAEAAHEGIDASGMLIDPANKLTWEREIAAVRREVEEAAWEEAWSAGRAMSIDQALASVDSITWQ